MIRYESKGDEDLRFVAPGKKYESRAREYVQEFIDQKSSLDGTGGLKEFLEDQSYEKWLIQLEENSDTSVRVPGRVNDATFFYVREEDDTIIGMVNIRFGLNAFLFLEGGHIGYSIRPTERGKGYATRMLKEALGFCRLIGLSQVLVVCAASNEASVRVIEKCGGVLEDEVVSKQNGEVLRRYWIENEGGIV